MSTELGLVNQMQSDIVARNVKLSDYSDNSTTNKVTNNTITPTSPPAFNISNNFNANSTAISDLRARAEYEKAKEERRNAALLEESKRLDEKKTILQKYIYNNANPSPLLIIGIVVSVVFCLWVIYVVFLKPTIDGEWRDEYGNKVNMCHNQLTGKIKVYMNGKYGGTGVVIDNYVKYGQLIGIWDYNNEIIFVGGTRLRRIL